MNKGSTLKHIGTSTKSPVVTRYFDPYVLCSVRVEQERIPTLLYWKLQNERQMIEIGINSISGEFVSMVVVLYRGPFQFSEQEIPRTIHEGVPVFSKKIWKMNDPYNNSAYYSIQAGGFEIYMVKNSFQVRLSPDSVDYFVGISEFFLCSFTKERRLIGFVIENLTEDERRQIELYQDMQRKYS